MSLLIDPNDSVLLVIDVQADFLARIEDATKAGLLERIAFLVESARYCAIPVIASIESPDDWGGLHPELVESVGDAPVLHKVVFGLADDPLVGPAVRETGRRTAVLVGLETDVCVAQSALGLLAEGFRVAVVEDAVASPGSAHAAGLDRMRRAGVIPVVAKQLHYEWMRTVAQSRAFRAAHPGFENPPGVLL
ncbi:MAG: isochorismatase family protein [Thermoleophilia bacterium]|nr:isochorismatase family protein [Thermoleophilia bacterium]